METLTILVALAAVAIPALATTGCDHRGRELLAENRGGDAAPL
jgi:hypothetical protein